MIGGGPGLRLPLHAGYGAGRKWPAWKRWGQVSIGSRRRRIRTRPITTTECGNSPMGIALSILSMYSIASRSLSLPPRSTTPRSTCSGLREQPRIVETGGHDHALFGLRAGQYYRIDCSC